MENVNNLIKNNNKSTDDLISKNLNLKDSDVVQIWDEVSAFIEKFMTQSKGVTIPNFGTFSFSQKKIDIGNSKFILAQRPVFAIAEKFAQTHGLNKTKYPVAGHIPVHPLNYIAIANETAFSRDDVESCVRHVLQVLNRSIQSRKNVEFTFTGIGKLQIRNSKIKMKFFKSFVNACDQSGKMVNSMQNRPNTTDSVISRNDMPSRAHTRNTCILPRINSRSGAYSSLDNLGAQNASMDTINEEGNETSRQTPEINMDTSLNLTIQSNEKKILAPIVGIYSSEDSSNNEKKAPINEYNNSESIVAKTTTTNANNQPHKYHIPTVFELSEVKSTSLVFPSNEEEKHLSANELKSINNLSFSHDTSLTAASSSNLKKLELLRPSPKTLMSGLKPKSALQSPSHSSCGHINAGQELCYLCHQRQRRNVPVYLHEEQRLKEQEEAQLLSQYQQLKDLEHQLKEEEARNELRLDRSKIDAFNLGVSEALKAKKLERPKTSDISRSFVFRKRCKTPPKFVKQHELDEYLKKQIETRQREFMQNKQDNDFLERMEQQKLAEDLAARREAYLREKNQRQNELKNVLDYQVKNKPAELPKVVPDNEVFGDIDAKNERLAFMKSRELETFNFHKNLIEERKRINLLKSIREQEQDAENLERVKEEYRQDRANKFKRMFEMRKNLEGDWLKAFEEKKFRDIDEIQHRLAHDGNLVHEQCDKYKRCAQCQRDVKNCGESNIWKDTHNTAGNRIIV